jgi:LmeA-like phospholipid-binding
MGEKAISKAAEMGLSAQLDEAEKLDVDIRTNPLDLLQGKLQSVTVEGEGLVMKKDLRAKELSIQTNEVAINSLKAALGNIELTHPTEAKARLVLTDEDIERAFNSQYIKQKLQKLKIDRQDSSLTVDINDVKFTIPEAEKVSLEATLKILETKEKEKVAFTAIPRISKNGDSVTLEDITYPQNNDFAPELTSALVNSASAILDLKNFDLKEMSLNLKKLDVQPGKMILIADAKITDFPDAN